MKSFSWFRLAECFVRGAHAGQKRKYTGEPYSVHCEGVARQVFYTDVPDHVVVAAMLHDTLEDTKVTEDDIRELFGQDVLDLVKEVTDVSIGVPGNRAQRKKMDLEHLAGASSHGQTIKCADLIDNTASIVEHDLAFAKVYLAEKRELLKVLTKAHPSILNLAWRTLNDAERELAKREGEV